jgi:hypothetical protein
MRRLAAHPAVGAALAAGSVSPSWAREICDWSDLLPAGSRGDADVILLAAAAARAALADLAGLAQEMRSRTARPDQDSGDDGFEDRSVRLDLHYQGAGKLAGDLTPRCAAALAAVLDALAQGRAWASVLPVLAAVPDPAGIAFPHAAKAIQVVRRRRPLSGKNSRNWTSQTAARSPG